MFAKAFMLFRDLRFDLRFAHHCYDDDDDDDDDRKAVQLPTSRSNDSD